MPKIIIYGLFTDTSRSRQYAFIRNADDDDFLEYNVKKGVSVQKALNTIRKMGLRGVPVDESGNKLEGVIGYDERAFRGTELTSMQFEKQLKRDLLGLPWKEPKKGD